MLSLLKFILFLFFEANNLLLMCKLNQASISPRRGPGDPSHRVSLVWTPASHKGSLICILVVFSSFTIKLLM